MGLLRRREADEFSAVMLPSDGAGEFGEDHCELRPLVDIQSEFVVAAAEVLHKRVPGTDHPCRAEPCQAGGSGLHGGELADEQVAGPQQLIVGGVERGVGRRRTLALYYPGFRSVC